MESMIRIDDTLLEEIGLITLPKAERDQLLRQIYETLEMRVGMRLAERMTDQQLDEFERFIDTNDEAGALKWLESNFPDYKQVVADELDKLKAEIKKDSTKIMETMQAQGGQIPAGQTQPAPLPPAQPAPFGAPAPAAPQPFQPQVSVSQPFEPVQLSSAPVPQPLPPLPGTSDPASFSGSQPLTPIGQDASAPIVQPAQDNNNYTAASQPSPQPTPPPQNPQDSGVVPPPPSF